MDTTKFDGIKHKIVSNLEANFEEVRKLLNFDASVLNNVIEKLSGLEKTAKERLDLHENHDFMRKLANTLKETETIRDHGSVNSCYYRTINNQCVVLLISHFSATLHDLFRDVIEIYINNSITDHLDDVAKIEVTVKELINQKKSEQCMGDVILEKDKTKSVNFQDMKSTKRAFDSFFRINLLGKTSEDEKNIIFAQTARHNIVHYGSKVNQHFLNRIGASDGRSLKAGEQFKDGDELEFGKEEVEVVANSMKIFVDNVFREAEAFLHTHSEAEKA